MHAGHEMRNALGPVRTATYLLRASANDDAQAQWALDLIDRQVQAITMSIDELADFARITRGALELQSEPMDFRDVLDSAASACAVTMTEKRQTLGWLRLSFGRERRRCRGFGERRVDVGAGDCRAARRRVGRAGSVPIRDSVAACRRTGLNVLPRRPDLLWTGKRQHARRSRRIGADALCTGALHLASDSGERLPQIGRRAGHVAKAGIEYRLHGPSGRRRRLDSRRRAPRSLDARFSHPRMQVHCPEFRPGDQPEAVLICCRTRPNGGSPADQACDETSEHACEHARTPARPREAGR